MERLKFWHLNVSLKDNNKLVTEGEDELLELAERMQKRFPQLITDTYDPNLYNFKYTRTERTRESARNFAIGLFGRHGIPEALFDLKNEKYALDDSVLRVSSSSSSRFIVMYFIIVVVKIVRKKKKKKVSWESHKSI